MTKKNEVTIKQETAVSTEVKKDWGASEGMGANDLLISKIFHQQALSKFVQDEKANAGDWCDSLTGEVIAKRDEPLQLIIFSSFRKLLINIWNAKSNRFEWVRSEDLTPENAVLPFEEDTPEGRIRRQIQYNYFVLLADKVNELPYVISFQSTKVKAAKKLNTMFAKLARLQKPSASFVFELSSIKETGDKGSWYGVEITQGRAATTEQLDTAYDWYQKIKASNVVITDETSDGEVSHTADDEDEIGMY